MLSQTSEEFNQQLFAEMNMDFDNLIEELDDDLNIMGQINLDPHRNDLLAFPDFCRINKLIKKYTHPIMVPTLRKLIE